MKTLFLRALASLLALTCLFASMAKALERLEPANGCYIGMLLAEEDTPNSLSARLGLTPAVFSRFYSFPLDASARQNVSEFLDQVRAIGGIAVLTLEPFNGLSAVTAANCNDFADLCGQKEGQGLGGIMVRFAHEMNGNWYAWGQQPALYRQTFQLLASAVHTKTIRTAMLWTPNNGIGYPFGTGTYSPTPGSPNFLELDTNHDGALTSADDMFEPFYPGDAAVDWVGLTLYHWGLNYPWLENESPYGGEFASVMNATGPGVPASYSRWFYPRYCSDGVHNKPLVIAETSAFYNTQQPGANEVAMKQAWFRQLYNISGASADGPDVASTFPKLKCINWFDHYKREGEAQNQFVDWRASANPLVRNAFLSAIQTLRNGQPYFLTAHEFNAAKNANSIIPTDLPALLPLTGNVSAVLKVTAQDACDLEVDLLDQAFNFKGGARFAIPAGTSTVPVSFVLNQVLIDGTPYRWSIFLTPTGGTFMNALARHTGPDPVAREVAPFTSIIAAPPTSPASALIPVRVQYVASSDAALNITLSNANGDARGTGTVNVKRGTGLLELNVTPLVGNSAGSYTLVCMMTNPALLAQSSAMPIQINPAPAFNSVSLASEPPTFTSGDVFRYAVNYAATVARDIRLEISNPSGTLIATATQPVAAGSKTIEMTVSYDPAPAGAYTARAFVVPTGGTSAQALASSAIETFQVVSPAYSQWTLTRWGVILASDAIDPQLDPDGDGSINSSEYVALTDPRNPASILRPDITRTGNQLTVSWTTSVGRKYLLFSRPALSSGSWVPANTIQSGTGNPMNYNANLNTAGALNFYQVQVSLP